ncbi:lytic transglycosylase domain-containing protein [Nocardiopsis sp. CNT312]|uniref:aggregation-promoting factor C-terminal-like domain-containing protein n=1 Tax=Nocardiopsis sp. CNT312 TaxID=1137268 RepID=UPI0018CBF34F|nr:lytic transglycosylase domain-containing protein [Nocardiopsis sp. CNT312]
MSLRSTAAVGAAALVAGATFAVSAFSGGEIGPEQAADTALAPETPGEAADAADGDGFFTAPAPSAAQLQESRAEARLERDTALGAAAASAQAQGTALAPAEPDEPEAPVFTGDARGLALQMVLDQGWPASEFTDCLEPLWQKESNWNHLAENPSSGAYGIPQSLPGSKMASHGADWRTNPATQIAWGLDYIKGRYGTPCGAWSTSQSQGWY